MWWPWLWPLLTHFVSFYFYFNSFLFYVILFYFILFYSILFFSIAYPHINHLSFLSCSVPPYSLLPFPVLVCPVSGFRTMWPVIPKCWCLTGSILQMKESSPIRRHRLIDRNRKTNVNMYVFTSYFISFSFSFFWSHALISSSILSLSLSLFPLKCSCGWLIEWLNFCCLSLHVSI